MTDHASGPIARSTTNMGQLPKAVGTEIIGTMSDISGSFDVMLHKSQGMVFLTMPPSELFHAENSPSRLHAFEETRTLLSQEFPDEEEALTPLDEIKFSRKH
jgi:hypothetical protein